jgi:UDP-N-acetylglucosamine transferase subunit ALG13
VIFVTVGTQLPFDRLVRAVDAWAARNPRAEVFGQIGPAAYKPKNFESAVFLAPSDVERRFAGAELIVGHAGMGTILASLTMRIPIIVVPRRQLLGEHRSNHQLATAQWLKDELSLNIVLDTGELAALLDRRHELRPGREIGEVARAPLLDTLRRFVQNEVPERSAIASISSWMSGLRKALHERGTPRATKLTPSASRLPRP